MCIVSFACVSPSRIVSLFFRTLLWPARARPREPLTLSPTLPPVPRYPLPLHSPTPPASLRIGRACPQQRKKTACIDIPIACFCRDSELDTKVRILCWLSLQPAPARLQPAGVLRRLGPDLYCKIRELVCAGWIPSPRPAEAAANGRDAKEVPPPPSSRPLQPSSPPLQTATKGLVGDPVPARISAAAGVEVGCRPTSLALPVGATGRVVLPRSPSSDRR